jgi:Tfp pilus assembly protein PilV
MGAPARRQRGASLVEALIAFMVLSLGTLGIAHLQRHVEHGADLARQRSEAVRLAQQDIEQLRAFAAMSAASGVRSYADIAPADTSVDAASGYRSNASYRVERRIAEEPDAALKTATVLVRWTDRTGQPQSVLLQSAVAGMPPALSAALPVQAHEPPMKTVHGRSPRIPASARKLAGGRSVLKPAASGGLAFVLSNATGRVTERCSATADTADPSDCVRFDALLLSGWIRLSLAAPPAADANDKPLPVAVSLVLTGADAAPAPECFTEPRERIVAYHCVIAASGPWSGRSTVVPQGWTLAAEAGAFKVCRYSGDHDGSGAIDRNAEHPEHYSNVDVSLMQQNFLLVRGDQACPANTVQHQP